MSTMLFLVAGHPGSGRKHQRTTVAVSALVPNCQYQSKLSEMAYLCSLGNHIRMPDGLAPNICPRQGRHLAQAWVGGIKISQLLVHKREALEFMAVEMFACDFMPQHTAESVGEHSQIPSMHNINAYVLQPCSWTCENGRWWDALGPARLNVFPVIDFVLLGPVRSIRPEIFEGERALLGAIAPKTKGILAPQPKLETLAQPLPIAADLQ